MENESPRQRRSITKQGIVIAIVIGTISTPLAESINELLWRLL